MNFIDHENFAAEMELLLGPGAPPSNKPFIFNNS